MPQPLTHYYTALEGVQQAKPALATAYANAVAFGSFGPDLFYVKDMISSRIFTGKNEFEAISDAIHRCNTFTLFTWLLDRIKRDYAETQNEGNRDIFKAFAYGFYSHVVTDCIIHPFVYRKTGDHWRDHVPEEYYKEHKELETKIDNILLLEKTNARLTDYKPVIGLRDGRNPEMLNMDLAVLLNDGIRDCYSNDIDWEYYFGRYDICKESHTLHDAYRDYETEVNFTTLGIRVLHKNINGFITGKTEITDDMKPIIMNEAEEPWHNSCNDLNYSVRTLYSMAVTATAMVVNAAEDFFASSSANSMEYFLFSAKLIPYLKDDFNLDTGLPSRFSQNEQINSPDPNTRYSYGTKQLLDIYSFLG